MLNQPGSLVKKGKTAIELINYQIVQMRKSYPQFQHKINPDATGYVSFIGTLKPHELSPEYLVKIIYRNWKSPRVYILSPKLVDSPPHFYHKTGTLCLFHPKEFKWNKNLPLTEYIIPWISSWVYFYEVWKECGVWYGEEAPHNLDEEKKQND